MSREPGCPTKDVVLPALVRPWECVEQQKLPQSAGIFNTEELLRGASVAARLGLTGEEEEWKQLFTNYWRDSNYITEEGFKTRGWARFVLAQVREKGSYLPALPHSSCSHHGCCTERKSKDFIHPVSPSSPKSKREEH